MNVLGISITKSDAPTPKAVPVALMTVAGLVAATGIAVANWSTNGSGTASAKAGSALGVTAPTLTTTTSTTGLLYPGANTGLVVTITNPNSFQVVVSAISVAAATQPASVAQTGSGCTVSNAAVSVPTTVSSFTLAGGAIAAGASVSFTSTSLTSGVSMGVASDNACQGASFGFNATVTAAAG